MSHVWNDDCYSGVDWERIDEGENIHLVSRSEKGSWTLYVSELVAEAISPGTIATANNLANLIIVTMILSKMFRDKWGNSDNVGIRQKLDYLEQGVEHILCMNDGLKHDVMELISGTKRPTDQFHESDRVTDQPHESKEMFEALERLIEGIDDRDFDSDDSTIYLDVFGFLPDSELFLGTRKHWKSGVSALSPNDMVSGTLLKWLFIGLNTRVTEELPVDVTATSSPPDFSRNLVSFGGPIPNGFMRNLLYDSDVSLPYRYCLNPEPEIKDLSSYSPVELREFGRIRKDEFDRPPNWHIADETGEPLKVRGKEARPVSGDGRWVMDYFMLTKTRNVYPDADPTKRCLTISGCHGFGTWGATRAIQLPDNVRRIHDEVGSNDFQAIGRIERTVKYNPDGTVDIEDHDPEILEVVAL